jgi:ABC-type glycerol-3-phosphate transport system substrate-binding protein
LPAEAYPHGKWEGELAAAYMEENPGTTIEYQALGWDALSKISTSIATGTAPNLILRGGHGMVYNALEADIAVEVELDADCRRPLACWPFSLLGI